MYVTSLNGKTNKVEYEKLERKIKEAEENRIGWHEESGIDLAAFSNISTKHHPSIIKVILSYYFSVPFAF